MESSGQTAPAGVTRKQPLLPPGFESINSNNISSKLSIIDELDPSVRTSDRGPFQVAKSIVIQQENEDGAVIDVDFDLDSLTSDQLRLLCKQVRCSGYASLSKYNCRKQLAAHAGLMRLYDQASRNDTMSSIKKRLNSDFRKVNTFFHKEMFEQVKSMNRLMKRADHEDGNTEKNTYIAMAELYNTTQPEFSIDMVDINIETDVGNRLANTEAICDADLTQFIPIADDGLAFKKFIREMFVLRKKIKANMTTVSGTHSNDPYDFIDVAMKTYRFAIHRLAVYYFFVKCEDNLSIDDEFQTSMPDELMGSSTNNMRDGGTTACSSVTASASAGTKRKMKNDVLESVTEGINSIAAVMATKEKREIKKDKRAAAKEERLADSQWQTQQIELLKSGVCSPASVKEIKESLQEHNRRKRNARNINSYDSSSE
jgi:hypothetical protein